MIESGNWARYETVRGKGSAANCIICGRKPQITEKGFYDGGRVFVICCPHCCNKHFRDKRETGVDITVCSETIYPGIRDWNKVNRKTDELVAHETRNLYDKRFELERQHGEWGKWIISEVRCPECLEYFDTDCYAEGELDKCPSCGAVIRPKEGEADVEQ